MFNELNEIFGVNSDFASCTKGQLISKRFLGSSISSKKRTNEFDFTTVILVFVRFLEEIEGIIKPFRNYMTFSKPCEFESFMKVSGLLHLFEIVYPLTS